MTEIVFCCHFFTISFLSSLSLSLSLWLPLSFALSLSPLSPSLSLSLSLSLENTREREIKKFFLHQSKNRSLVAIKFEFHLSSWKVKTPSDFLFSFWKSFWSLALFFSNTIDLFCPHSWWSNPLFRLKQKNGQCPVSEVTFLERILVFFKSWLDLSNKSNSKRMG